MLALCSQMALSVASASGNAIARFGGEHGTVNDTNPTALYYNPGALGFSEGTQLFLDGQLALRSFQWTHKPAPTDTIPPAGFEGSNFGTARALNVFGGPMLGGTLHVGDFVFGAAAYAPFGGNVSFGGNPRFKDSMYPGAADGIARWHGIDASTMSIYGTLGAAYRLGPVSFGVTGNLIYTTLHLENAQNLSGGNGLMDEGRARVDASGVNGSFGAGVMVEALPRRLWFAASYQAQPGLGTMAMDGKLEIDSSVPKGDDSLNVNITFHQALPDIWRLGARFRPSSTVELRVAGDLTRWNVLRTQCVGVRGLPCTTTANGDAAPGSGVVMNLRRYWQNTVGVRAGASYWVIAPLELFAGLGFETAAVPDSTLDPVLADADNVAASLGGRLELAPSWFLAAQYMHLQFLARDNTGKSKLADPATGMPSQRPDGGGTYTQWVGVLNANLLKVF